ncbi:MAG: hypothetical protein FWH39_05535, partial [Bacteroidales bacterium]|nr:hypothetical protein [Bacteroidales bacterium]
TTCFITSEVICWLNSLVFYLIHNVCRFFRINDFASVLPFVAVKYFGSVSHHIAQHLQPTL